MTDLAPLTPTLDHVVVNARDRLDEAAETWRRLGFTLTPRGHHTLGSMNYLIMFGTHYLELLGVPPGGTQRTELLDYQAGLDGLVFGTEDAAATHAALTAAGVTASEPKQFSRPVALADGNRDATFRTVTITPGAAGPGPGQGAAPVGRIYFCHHLTRDLVWRDEWRTHANGAIGISRVVIVAADPARLGGLFAKMFGAGAVRAIEGGRRLLTELVSVGILTPEAFAAGFGYVPEGGGRPEFMAAVGLRTRSLAQAEEALAAAGPDALRRGEERLIVLPSATGGAGLIFHE